MEAMRYTLIVYKIFISVTNAVDFWDIDMKIISLSSLYGISTRAVFVSKMLMQLFFSLQTNCSKGCANFSLAHKHITSAIEANRSIENQAITRSTLIHVWTTVPNVKISAISNAAMQRFSKNMALN